MTEIDNAKQTINEQISELQGQIDLLNSINIDGVIDEELWHQICETPLRSSKLMATFVQNIFPDATDIVVHCNYVYFKIMGFGVQIPTSQARGINVHTGWYTRYGMQIEPFEEYLSEQQLRIYKYLEAVDNKDDWKTIVKLRVDRPEWMLPFLWFLKYKWENPKREKWAAYFKNKRAEYEESVARRMEIRKEMHNKVILLHDELLPILNRFSTVHNAYNSNDGMYSIYEIFKFEGIDGINENHD